MHIDPIEKKPLFHFLPGSQIFSIATVGCNLHCKNCQNWEISQCNPEDSVAFDCPPEKIVELAKSKNCPSIAYTYTDPVIYYEYTLDTAKLANQENMRSVLVTAGYINETPWKQLLEYIDGAHIDLKSMSDDFYRRICSATLKPVLQSIVMAKTMGVHIEITNLVIPTLNDKPEDITQMAKWIKANIGTDTPLHFLAFYPRYQMLHLPPTSAETLEMARNTAISEGLEYVYIGNVSTKNGQNTFCPGCKQLLIERSMYTVIKNRVRDGRCPNCSKQIIGVWK